MDYKDYYQILGVDRNADAKEIKRIYRKLARQYHPDLHPGDKKSEARFKEINEAYEVLSDPDKRRKYEELGQNYQRWQQTGGQQGGFDWNQWAANGQASQPGGTRVDYGNLEDIFAQGGFSDFFQTIFGGAGGAGGRGQGARGTFRQSQAPARNRDVEQEVEVSLEEAFQGAQRLLEMDGRRLEVKIPPGVKTGSRVRVPREALGAGDPNLAASHVYLRIKVLPHGTFERREDDLYADVPVDMFVALLGGEVCVTTLSGSVALRIPAGTQAGRTFRLAGQGMPKLRAAQERGDLFARVRVRLPENLSEQERQLVRDWAQLRGVRP